MDSYYIGLFSSGESRAYRGYASFRKNGESTWSRVIVSGLHPDDCYRIFYILKNPRQRLSAAEMGNVSVNKQGEITAELKFDNRISNGYCCSQKDVIGVALIEHSDKALADPVAGIKEDGINWKPLVEKYLMALECHSCAVCGDYLSNQSYDNILDSLPPSPVFKGCEKIEKAVEIQDLSHWGVDKQACGLAEGENALLIRMRTGDFVLYLLGLPGTYAGGRRWDYADNGFKTFLCSDAAETPQDLSPGYWCKYI